MEERLARFEIDHNTKANLVLFRPVLDAHIERTVIHFYNYLDQFPETRSLLKGRNIELMREKQKLHWKALLSGDFGAGYLHNTVMIGLVHFDCRLPPHLYMAAYSFFMSEMLRIGSAELGYGFQAIAISINKVIMMDMSIVLNAYFLSALAPADGPGHEGHPHAG